MEDPSAAHSVVPALTCDCGNAVRFFFNLCREAHRIVLACRTVRKSQNLRRDIAHALKNSIHKVNNKEQAKVMNMYARVVMGS